MNGFDMYQSMELIDDSYIEDALSAKPFKRHRARRAVLRTALIAAAVFLVFVGTINVFPATAYALCDIPVLGELARAVIFDPSMKECLSHSYVQYVGESQTVDGYYSEVCCMVVDAGRISIFFKSDIPNLAANDGDVYIEAFPKSTLRDYSFGINETDVEGLYEFRIDLGEDEQVPESFVFRIQYFVNDFNINPQKEVARAEYTLYPDMQYSTVVSSYEIDSALEIMGQTIHVDRLDVYPTQAKLYFSMDEGNSALLKDITITLYDETGRAYPQRSNGVIATGAANGDIRSKWFESPYFSKAQSLTVEITAVSFLDKDAQYGTVDYGSRTVENIPDGISVASMILDDEGTLKIALKVPDSVNSQIVSLIYRDMQGNEYYTGYSWSPSYWSEDSGTAITEDGYGYVSFSIANYSDNNYQIEWLYTPETVLETPIAVKIFG